MENVKDSYLEHIFHTDEWDKNCSECFKEKQTILNAPRGYKVIEDRSLRSIDLSLAGEQSEHLTNYYW